MKLHSQLPPPAPPGWFTSSLAAATGSIGMFMDRPQNVASFSFWTLTCSFQSFSQSASLPWTSYSFIQMSSQRPFRNHCAGMLPLFLLMVSYLAKLPTSSWIFFLFSDHHARYWVEVSSLCSRAIHNCIFLHMWHWSPFNVPRSFYTKT